MTADSDFTPGPDNVSFTAGQMSATLMVSTMEDNIVEPSETFMVMITSVDSLGNVDPGSPSSSVVRIVSGIYALYYSLSLIVWNIVYLLPMVRTFVARYIQTWWIVRSEFTSQR